MEWSVGNLAISHDMQVLFISWIYFCLKFIHVQRTLFCGLRKVDYSANQNSISLQALEAIFEFTWKAYWHVKMFRNMLSKTRLVKVL